MKEPEEKLLEVDYGRVHFRVGIDVCRNGNKFYCFDVEPGYDITYQTIIGVLECMKFAYMEQQAAQNRKSDTVTDAKDDEKKFKKAVKKFKAA